MLVSYLLWERKQTLAETRGVIDGQLKLLDKAFALIASKDPLTFQAVQAMGMQYPETTARFDPSDEAEYERTEGDDLNGDERNILSDIPGFF